jgi:hypothetical protein
MIDGKDSLSKDEQVVPSLRDQDDDIAISPQTPYSAIIRIAREGIIKPAPRLQDTPNSTVFTSESLGATTAAVGYSSTYDTSELSSFNFALQQGDLSSLTAGLDDWASQGVDTALFDSLLRSTSLGEHDLNDTGTFRNNMNSTQQDIQCSPISSGTLSHTYNTCSTIFTPSFSSKVRTGSHISFVYGVPNHQATPA